MKEIAITVTTTDSERYPFYGEGDSTMVRWSVRVGDKINQLQQVVYADMMDSHFDRVWNHAKIEFEKAWREQRAKEKYDPKTLMEIGAEVVAAVNKNRDVKR